MLVRTPRLAIAWCFYVIHVAVLSSIVFAQSATQLPASQLISPEALVKILQSQGSKPLIFNLGPRLMYDQGHIPGAEYLGPGADPQVLRQLHERARKLPRNSSILIYCGCCAWIYCPNVNPAYRELSSMGFTNVKVLKIDHNFGTDWMDKKYPSVRE